MNSRHKKHATINYLTVDVEEYFQVSAFENVILVENWSSYESRIRQSIDVILEIFDLFEVKATFFVVGWIAEKYPDLVSRIVKSGHDIGCHSYYHKRIYKLSPAQFYDDTRKCKDILEEITGKSVTGYRAPSYSITRESLWALDVLAELGFRYDSSIFPIYHDSYGIPDAPRFAYQLPDSQMVEYPLSTVLYWGRKIPVAGGGYFRLFPYWFIRSSLQRINEVDGQPFVFYFHPWEIDPGQPRINNISSFSRFRHYNNLGKTFGRLQRLLTDFSFQPLPSGNV